MIAFEAVNRPRAAGSPVKSGVTPAIRSAVDGGRGDVNVLPFGIVIRATGMAVTMPFSVEWTTLVLTGLTTFPAVNEPAARHPLPQHDQRHPDRDPGHRKPGRGKRGRQALTAICAVVAQHSFKRMPRIDPEKPTPCLHGASASPNKNGLPEGKPLIYLVAGEGFEPSTFGL